MFACTRAAFKMKTHRRRRRCHHRRHRPRRRHRRRRLWQSRRRRRRRRQLSGIGVTFVTPRRLAARLRLD
jgi:hypothetical protein